ncbi:hypothetical protein ABW19_dt0206418 [Dactylella cylindrospora]|nr:hypothetical protein ABW19_dt0206418 [Dactylella cylindrospora]
MSPAPRTSSTIPPFLQHISRIDSPENPKIMSEESKSSKKGFSIPLLRLRVNDVCCEGAASFFASVNAERALTDAVIGVLDALYTPDNAPKNVRSVTLILRPMGGVAYTTGSDLDDDHKEIHFSTDYIAGVHQRSKGGQDKEEILGVIRHEMVHCFQYNAKGTCNGGLIEGIADWVRYKGGFIPPHWHVGSGDNWDDGYQNTAYFLLWLEKQYGPATVPKINEWLRDHHYSDELWLSLFAEKPEDLWKKYKKTLEDTEKDKDAQTQTVITSNDPPDNTSSKAESYVEVPPVTAEATDKVDDRAIPLFQISEFRLIARDRLSKLTYGHRQNFKRFITSFESLIEILDPKMPDSEKKLLLTTALVGDITSKLDAIDPENTKSYAEIKAALMF